MCGPSHWGQLGTLVRAVPCKVYPKETGVSRPKGTWKVICRCSPQTFQMRRITWEDLLKI